ncbi:MAG: hypothetical protein EVA89_23835 [Sandaracinaceae bacterium]|nr:MAG: hypothetical protein EVA89_23835 [Sandaracinaceae bacterium]
MRLALIALLLLACGETGPADAGADGSAADAGAPEPTLTVVTFNTGTTEGLDHDGAPDDGYTSEHAARSDTYYGDGLAWRPAVEAARAFFERVDPDIVVFQEIFHADECADIPPDAHPDFVCETWSPGDPTVAAAILPLGFQVACHPGKPDKCAAVHRRVGTFRGCDADFCLEGLSGTQVDGCGRGARVARGIVDLVDGGTLTVVNVHGTSGVTADEQACRVAQFEQAFALADGETNLVMGDLNTDPGRLAGGDPSAARVLDFVGDGLPFHFVTDTGRRATPTYAGLFNIDHVISDRLEGRCVAAGITEGEPGVIEAVYFDHAPIVCRVGAR